MQFYDYRLNNRLSIQHVLDNTTYIYFLHHNFFDSFNFLLASCYYSMYTQMDVVARSKVAFGRFNKRYNAVLLLYYLTHNFQNNYNQMYNVSLVL